MIKNKQATFRIGYKLGSEETYTELKDNRIIIKTAQGKELKVLVQEDGSFIISLDNMNFIPIASNHATLVSKRYREE